MDPERSNIESILVSDVVEATAGRDRGKLLFVLAIEGEFLLLANGKDRPLEKPKRKKCKHVRKVLRPDTRVALKIASGDKVLNSELRRDLAYLSREMQSIDLGG